MPNTSSAQPNKTQPDTRARESQSNIRGLSQSTAAQSGCRQLNNAAEAVFTEFSVVSIPGKEGKHLVK